MPTAAGGYQYAAPFEKGTDAAAHTSSKHLECVLVLLLATVGRTGAGCLDRAEVAAGVDAEAMTHVMKGFCWMRQQSFRKEL